MANIVYSNPGASYVSGQTAGLEDSIRAGQAARNFRDSDVNAAFQKWYQPLRQREATAATGQSELGLNEGIEKNAAGLASYGAPGQQYNSDVLDRILPGYGFGGVTANSNLDYERTARQAAGLDPSFYDPTVASVGRYGAVKKETLNPEEFRQAMLLRGLNPNGQPVGTSPAGVPEFDPYGAATNHIFGPSTGGAGGVQATPAVPAANAAKPWPTPYGPNPMAQPQGNPHEYGNGGIFTPMDNGAAASGNQRVASPTGGF